MGSKLLSVEFQNYAMRRLYTGYATGLIPKPLKIVDFEYVCKNSATGSQLRQLFFTIVAIHFTNSGRIEGSVEDWDRILLEHPEARLLLLKEFRMPPWNRQSIKAMEEYMVTEQAQPVNDSNVGDGVQIILAKRDREDMAAKRDQEDTAAKRESTDN